MARIVVTGASSGIGEATVRHLASRGHEVYAAMRKVDAADFDSNVIPVTLDVQDDESVRSCFEAVLADGPLDALVNNAGIGYNAVTEDLNTERARELFDVNVLGAVRCVQRVLPSMRDRRTGTIVNMSSIAGRLPLIGQVAYSMSKFALEAMSQALAQEVARYGVRVRIIEPGVVMSKIFEKNTTFPEPTEYGWAYERETAFYLAGIMAGHQASEVASTVEASIEADHPQLRWACGWGAHAILNAAPRVTDDEWVRLGMTDDAAYSSVFHDLFGVEPAALRSRRPA